MELIIYIQDMWQLAINAEVQGIWFWAALYTFIVCVYSLIFQIRTRYWPFTPGKLSEFRVEKFGPTDLVKSDQDYKSKALYKYKVSDVVYEGTRVSPWVFVVSHNARIILEKQKSYIQCLPNDNVKVFYNPDNPQKSYLIIAGKASIYITLLISFLPLISYYFKYYM